MLNNSSWGCDKKHWIRIDNNGWWPGPDWGTGVSLLSSHWSHLHLQPDCWHRSSHPPSCFPWCRQTWEIIIYCVINQSRLVPVVHHHHLAGIHVLPHCHLRHRVHGQHQRHDTLEETAEDQEIRRKCQWRAGHKNTAGSSSVRWR